MPMHLDGYEWTIIALAIAFVVYSIILFGSAR